MPGLEEYTQDDLKVLAKMLISSQGENELMSWIKDWVSAHLAITQGSQIIGVPLMLFAEATPVVTEESTVSATFVDLSTRGPELTGMADGNWIIIWGCLIRESGALDTVAQMAVQPSWAGLSDSQVASAQVFASTKSSAVFSRAFGAQGPAVVDSTGRGNSSIRGMYRRQAGTGTPNFSNRWLVAVRTGPDTPGN